MAWMDLLRQYHGLLADEDVGPAAVAALDGFTSDLTNYYQDSSVQALLRSIP